MYLQHHCAYTTSLSTTFVTCSTLLFLYSFPLFCDAKREKEHHLSISPSHQRALAQRRSLYRRSTLNPSGTLEEDRPLLRHSICEYRIPRLSSLGTLVASSIELRLPVFNKPFDEYDAVGQTTHPAIYLHQDSAKGR